MDIHPSRSPRIFPTDERPLSLLLTSLPPRHRTAPSYPSSPPPPNLLPKAVRASMGLRLFRKRPPHQAKSLARHPSATPGVANRRDDRPPPHLLLPLSLLHLPLLLLFVGIIRILFPLSDNTAPPRPPGLARRGAEPRREDGRALHGPRRGRRGE